MRLTNNLIWSLSSLLVAALLLLGCAEKRSNTDKNTQDPTLKADTIKTVGGDRDKFGCISSAGYQWCASENRCVRPWEITQEKSVDNTKEAFSALCNDDPILTKTIVGNDRDEYGCISSAGYQWCEKTGTCIRPWELAKQQSLNNTPETIKAFCHQQ